MMKLSHLLLTTIAIIFFVVPSYAQKKALSHSVYDSWESVRNTSVPYNGKFLLYSVNKQEGDNILFLYNLQSNVRTQIERGKDGRISEDGNYLLYKISPFFAQTRDAKIKKKKDDEMPKDTLAIMRLKDMTIRTYANIKSLEYGNQLRDYIAFSDTTSSNSLYIINLNTFSADTIKGVDQYIFSDNGEYLSYITKPSDKDSLAKKEIRLYFPKTKRDILLLSGEKKDKIELPVFDKSNNKLAFHAQKSVYLFDIKSDKKAKALISNNIKGIRENWMIWDKTPLSFSDDGQYLQFGTKPKPKDKDTTIAEFERVNLDIWRWNADFLPTYEKASKKSFEKTSYKALIYFKDTSKIVQLADEDLPTLNIPQKNTHNYVLSLTDKPYRIQSQWNSGDIFDLYKVDITTGERVLLKKGGYLTSFTFSQTGNYYLWFNSDDKGWYLYETSTGSERNITKDLPAIFWDDEDDTPSIPQPCSHPIWFEDESQFILGSKYDLWLFDPKGINPPEQLTEGVGKSNSIRFRVETELFYHSDDNSKNGISNDRLLSYDEPLYISSFNKINKEGGLYLKDLKNKKKGKLIKLIEGPFTFQLHGISTSYEYPGIVEHKSARARRNLSIPIYIYSKGDFQNPYDLYISRDMLRSENKITSINPNQKDYNWGTVELINWTTTDSIKAEGLLYKPENFDPTKKYPVIIYFYEKDSDYLYSYLQPSPSRSVINIPYFVSNGYIVFDPNIYYKEGHPGQCAINSIMPAVDMLCKNSWFDGENMAIQGQSWGGYQVAYMITQTDRFKAACAGAPVSNMTSAYGGIRWNSGITRQFQYEMGQSRIGKDLWSGFDLYYDNSPLFFVPNVKTPILIMHNDKDGSVPWYQGIEFFVGLRRCGKQAWMLQYIGEDHNLIERHNAKDLSVKLSDFFDHFLKNGPMPEWMK